MTTESYKTGLIEVAPNAYAFIQENCATSTPSSYPTKACW